MQEPKSKGSLEYVHALHPFMPTSVSPIRLPLESNAKVLKTVVKPNYNKPVEIVYDAETNAPISFTKSVWTSKEGRLNMDARTILGMGTGKLDISKTNESVSSIEKKNDLVQLFHSKGPLVPIFHKKWSAKTGDVDYDGPSSSSSSVSGSVNSSKHTISKSMLSSIAEGSNKSYSGQVSSLHSLGMESDRISPLMFEDMAHTDPAAALGPGPGSIKKTNFLRDPVVPASQSHPRKQSVTSHMTSSQDGQQPPGQGQRGIVSPGQRRDPDEFGLCLPGAGHCPDVGGPGAAVLHRATRHAHLPGAQQAAHPGEEASPGK